MNNCEPNVSYSINKNVLRIRWQISDYDPRVVLKNMKKVVLQTLTTQSEKFNDNIKWYIILEVEMEKTVHDECETRTVHFRGVTQTCINIRETDAASVLYNESQDKILNTIETYLNTGSGWCVHRVRMLELNIVRYRPIHGANSSYIKLPPFIANKKAVINVKNPNDNKCFLWSVLAYLYNQPGRNYQLSWYKKYEKTLNMDNINYPVKLKDIDKFERQNVNLSVNVITFEEENSNNEQKYTFYPLRVTKFREREHVIQLLLIPGTTKEHFHYCLINTKKGFNGLSRLLCNLTKVGKATHYCPFCLHRFSSEKSSTAKLNCEKHIEICKNYGVQRIKLPSPDSEQEKIMKFRDYSSTIRTPYTIYADFESFIKPTSSNVDINTHEDSSYTKKISVHVPSGYCYVIIDADGNICYGPKIYRANSTNDNVAEKMLDDLLTYSNHLYRDMKTERKMIISREEEILFKNAIECVLCKKPLFEDRVRHHLHSTGKYIGPCHNACNLNCKKRNFIPVFFHNLSGYDSHHIVQALGKYKTYPMNCIANTSERYVTINLGPLRFLDTFKFMNSSLEKLVEDLSNNCQDKNSTFKRLSSYLSYDTEKRDILMRKGIYPYEYMTDERKFNETQLPNKKQFFNRLGKIHITNEEYQHAKNVWEMFNIKTLGEYHDLYLLSDVLLLADVFENFRDVSISNYNLDPCHFFSTPHFTWNAMLKMTKVKLELLSDIDMHLFIEQGIRGGVAMISNRFAAANNPLLSDKYKKTLPTSWIQYYDCTNLYGTAMVEKLPYKNFSWLTHEEIENFDYENIPEEGKYGYIVECDLCYPIHLHALHNDYPLAPEKKIPPQNITSPFFVDCKHEKKSKTSKLLTTLEDKHNYVLHLKNLKLYTSLGLQLTKIHRVLKFRQSHWLRPYIEFNTVKRKEARNNFEKDFFKLMNNAVYGKSLENQRNHVDFKLITDEKKLDKVIAKPRVKQWFIYNEDVVGVCLKKTEIFLNRPIYIGFTVLDLSKYIMYNFHYNYSVKKYGNKIKLLMTDTDSFMYHIETEDVYKDMKKDLHLFDTSDYAEDHPCFSTVNKKKLGTFKDEMNGKQIREFVGLRAKMYSFLTNENINKKVAKGIPRVSIEHELKHEHYKNCLFNRKPNYTTSESITSSHHKIYTIEQRKLTLSPYDDKRYILKNGVNTLAYGHYKISREKRQREHDDDESDKQIKKKLKSY